MAERRMFSKAITNSARFLRMPIEARLLYYDLGMLADDDGIVEAFTVIRTTGSTETALETLAKNSFVVVFNDELVTYITDWKKNNQIRKDRYNPSIYADLLQGLTNGEPLVNQWVTQDSIDKVSTDKESKEKVSKADKPPRTRFVVPTVEEVREYCKELNNNVDPQMFVDYYTSNGWMVGRNKMKDWKATIRRWAKKDNKGVNNGQDTRDTTEERHFPGTIVL